MNEPVKCPLCDQPMQLANLGSAHVHLCDGDCKGLWTTIRHLARLDHRSKGAGPSLQRVLAQPRTDDRRDHPLDCPQCGSAMDVRRHPQIDVTLDVCVPCEGIFLDAGELAALRHRELSPTERRRGPAPPSELGTSWRKAITQERSRDTRNWLLSALVDLFLLH